MPKPVLGFAITTSAYWLGVSHQPSALLVGVGEQRLGEGITKGKCFEGEGMFFRLLMVMVAS